MNSSNNFDRAFQEFKKEVENNTRELTKEVDEERRLEAEVATLQRTIGEDRRKIEKLKPEIRKLEAEKVKQHSQLSQLEQQNRAHMNEHITDKSKMIRPLGH